MSASRIPQDLDAEAAVLGGVLLDAAALNDIVQDLRPYHFYRENHGHIYDAFLNLYTSDEPIDTVIVARELERMGVLERVGGRAALAALYENAITSKHVAHYSRIVIDKARKRKIIGLLRKGVDECSEDKEDSQSILNSVTRELFDLTVEDALTSGVEHVGGDAIQEAIRRLYAAKNGVSSKVRYPWPDVDKMIPLRPGEVTVVAGRPSMGKSALALNVATHLSIKQGVPVGIFSLEMPTNILLQRMAAELSGVSTRDIERNEVKDDDFKKLLVAYDAIGKSPIYLDDAPSLDEATLIAKARAAKFNYNIGLFIIDYLQLMEGKGNNDNERVGGCARTVRKLARHLRTPFIEVCQLSRAPEARPDKRPVLSDLRDSGNIEQEADVAVFLFRDEYYTREKSLFPNQCELIVAKHRNGETGVVRLRWEKNITTFQSLEIHKNGRVDTPV